MQKSCGTEKDSCYFTQFGCSIYKSPTNYMPFTRTFHPVGQGAFYTEQHYDQGETLNIIYDCGSVTRPKSQFLLKVANALPAESVIDLLFISHFHDDHTNGIEELKKRYTIRTVVLPKLTEETRTLIKLENYLEYGGFSTALIDNPQLYFGKNTLIIEVDPVNADGEEPNAVVAEGNNGPFIEISPDEPPTFSPNLENSKQGTSVSIPSGTVFRFRTKSTPFWEYIPFNYEYAARKALLEASLMSLGISLDSLVNVNNIIAREADLRGAYKKLKGRLNANSLVVYSGAVGPNRMLFHQRLLFTFHYLFYFTSEAEGCLYLGDIDLTVANVVTDMKARLRNYWQKIYSVQVPHHGSIHNFNSSIFNQNAQAVISYGTTNKYSHPAPQVVSQLLRVPASPVCVTEKADTGLYSLD